MRYIDSETNLEIQNPDLEAGYIVETDWAPMEAYETIDNVSKFALEPSDYERVMLYRAWTQEEVARRADSDSYVARQALINGLPEVVSAYAADTDAALFDLDSAQSTYETETDAALFDLVDYIASLEARIEALEGING